MNQEKENEMWMRHHSVEQAIRIKPYCRSVDEVLKEAEKIAAYTLGNGQVVKLREVGKR